MAPHKLILLCDGTWLGREANTKTNIHLLAEMVGINMELEPTVLNTKNAKAYYTNGVRLGDTFLDYVIDGTIASQIDEECKDAYQYIVENYTPEHEIWMFGLSRGATTIRFVAGMINNCGIIKPTHDADGNIDHAMNKVRCDIVYDLYRSDDNEKHPENMEEYRTRNSFPVTTPIKFMGLFDTVGNLGIPQISRSERLMSPEPFYDNKISSVVEKVYHAVSTHDRLIAFKPTPADRDRRHLKNPSLEIYEKWFPGTHYDLCRQKFRFFRAGFTPLGNFAGAVEPNWELSDLVLKWMLESVQKEDKDGLVVQNINKQIMDINERLRHGQHVGSGDVYESLLKYLPFGNAVQLTYWLADIWPSIMRVTGEPHARLGRGINIGIFTVIAQLSDWLARIWSSIWRGGGEALEGALEALLGVSPIKQGLLALEDRSITNVDAVVYHYKKGETSLFGRRIRDLANLSGERYPSKTFEKFMVFQAEMDLCNEQPLDRALICR